MLILNDNEIAGLLSFSEHTEALAQAMLAYENAYVVVPDRMHVANGANTLLCMPSFSGDYFSTKLVSVVPGNVQAGLPVTNGALLLNDSLTGMPLALMNAAKLTALRTGALGALGVKYMTLETVDSIGIIGCGIQGMHQAVFACSVRPLKKVYAYDRSEVAFQKMSSFVHSYFPDIDVIACNSTEDLLLKTNVVITATTSKLPVLPDNALLLDSKHFISIGSFKPDMQELPDSVFQLAGCLVIDSEFARHEVGDILNPIQKGILKEENVFTFGKLITGNRKVNIHGTTAYKATGMALFDLYTARALYLKAKELNIGTIVNL